MSIFLNIKNEETPLGIADMMQFNQTLAMIVH